MRRGRDRGAHSRLTMPRSQGADAIPDSLDERLATFLLEPFAQFLTLEQGNSPRTLEAYGRDVARLAQFAIARGVAGPRDITSRLLREFVYHLKDVGLAPASIRRN